MKDVFDTWVTSINWKIGKFSVLPIVFGLAMSILDVVMMGILKMSNKGQISVGTALPIATLVYSLEPFLFMKSLKYESLTAMNLIWDLTSDVLVTCMGVFYFKESIKGLRWLAVLFALFSLGLFAYTEDS
jgi:multidrug transporter EmrE-like cation transporter